MMTLPLDVFEVYDGNSDELRGGQVRGWDYYVAVVEGSIIVDVYFGRLLNNFRSRKNNSSYPRGYLPFQFSLASFFRKGKYDIATKTLEFRRKWPSQTFFQIKIERNNARILKKPKSDSVELFLLKKMREQTTLRDQVHKAARVDLETLTIAGDLLQEAVVGAEPNPQIIRDPQERLELFLNLSSAETLRELLLLLQLGSDKKPLASAA